MKGIYIEKQGLYETEDIIKETICVTAFHPSITTDKYKCIGKRCPILRELDPSEKGLKGYYCGMGWKP
jgi:hypothetical protein